LDSKEYASAYAIAKICGYTGSFDDFKNLYTQYYSEIVNSLPEGKPDQAKCEAAINPMRNIRTIF
jgi:hypothetical protein